MESSKGFFRGSNVDQENSPKQKNRPTFCPGPDQTDR